MIEGNTFDIIHDLGYHKGVKKNKEVAIDFSKWLGKTYYFFNSDKQKWTHLIKGTELNDDEMFDMYLEESNAL